MSEPWSYELTSPALRDIARLDPPVRRRIFQALDLFIENPNRGDRLKLEGKANEWRLRVGDWRIRYRLDYQAHTMAVLRVLPRGSAYRD